MIVFLLYAAIFVASFYIVKLVVQKTTTDYTSLKTVTFGDESAVRPNRIASFVSIGTIFLLWGAFTGSSWIPGFLHAPGPFMGDATFTYTATANGQQPDDAEVTIRVFEVGTDVEVPIVDLGEGWAKNDADTVGAWRSGLVRVDKNDEYGRDDGHTITAVNGNPIKPGDSVETDYGRVGMSAKGTLNFEPSKGWQMEPIWLPSPEAVVARFGDIAANGYRGSSLWAHLGISLQRVILGFVFGALVGIPLGYAMGLSDWFRGWFDPIVEFMRPVPPLALIPLVIIWAGIGETGKVILLFLAALWIMAIAARAGVSGVAISKVHAAYSLGASKAQIMRHVIVPNSLPEIFTGARVAMGVCWGTVVAAELVAAEQGAGMMIMVASKFQLTDIVLMGIILIGIIGFGIDILMRFAEKALVPWKGKI
ncbi:ABC transporter permease [Pelagimonas varians]|uniref:Aliphatic sulfonates transport permease protein SsuC n=1 Tax=Pelagimonas varians TaxID=696760 RepID=A0A238K593_9RHOB|nr:ABC transporter permease subunit [Pelagimonas varians]PYG30578.1 taurine transport system permease protein [Pelagimonas varians]SMX37272.1 Putative aliphatic sulfonates transport permease protein SsuC [Pelagimonas varians]